MKPAKTSKNLVAPTSWDAMSWGEYYRDSLEQQLQPWLARMFGCHLLKIGDLSAEISTSACAIDHQVLVGAAGVHPQVIASPMQLPFAAKSVDACLLLHTLCWCTDPHHVLREVDRVLADDGWLVISGFNPWSLSGAGKCLPFLRQKAPYNSRMFSLIRQSDWLSLLNFQVMHGACSHVLPWLRQGGKLPGIHVPALGCLQLIVARKRTYPLMLLPQAGRRSKAQLRPVVGATRGVSRQERRQR